jgi:hypothetical protein
VFESRRAGLQPCQRAALAGCATRLLTALCLTLLASLLVAGCNRGSASTRVQRHLRLTGTSFTTADRHPFQWRGITAFRLLEYVARGKEDEVEQFLSWAERRRLTVVRVLAMGSGWMNLSAGDGRKALPRLLDLAAAHRLHVEIVALAGTRDTPLDLDSQLDAIGRIASEHDNALIEIANEPAHPSQLPDVHRPETLVRLRSRVPRTIPVALGLVEGLERASAGDYVTWHAPRDAGSDGWGHVLALAKGAELVTQWNKPVVSDEPIGAGAAFEVGRRDDSAERFRAAALVTRLAGLGATFHYEGGLQASIPTGRELECFNAWNEAWTLLPSDIERTGTFKRARDEGAAVVDYSSDKALAVFERQRGNLAWVAVINPSPGFAMRWGGGWNPQQTRRLQGVWLITARRDARQPFK